MRALIALAALSLTLAGCADPPENPRHREIIFAPAPGTSLAPGGPPKTFLGLDALTRCAHLQRDITDASQRFAAIDADLDARRGQLAAGKATIEAARPRTHVPDAVMAKFNADVAAFDADTHRFNADVAASNSAKARNAAELAAFNGECAGHSYWLDDMDQVDATQPPR